MAEKPAQKVEDVPDPDEDELDDLDDVLDEFQATSISQNPKASSPTPAPAASGPGRPDSSSKDVSKADPSEDEMAAQLQAGMSSLISELDSNPEMQAEFEKMMQELIAAGAAPTDQAAGEHLKAAAETVSQSSDSSKSKTSTSKKAPDDFQDTIRRTMERMQASGDAATAASTTNAAQSEEDLLAQMMKELTEGDGEGDFNSMLMNMMAHLTNKEILYDPMKELNDKFPDWMVKNKDTVGVEERTRYEEQARLVGEIVARFERKAYSDDNEDDREYIVERMQKMQAQGSPPPDLVGDMNAAQEALGDLNAGCPTQ